MIKKEWMDLWIFFDNLIMENRNQSIDLMCTRLEDYGIIRIWDTPKIWMVFVKENPNLTWMMTGGIPSSMNNLYIYIDNHGFYHEIWAVRLFPYIVIPVPKMDGF